MAHIVPPGKGGMSAMRPAMGGKGMVVSPGPVGGSSGKGFGKADGPPYYAGKPGRPMGFTGMEPPLKRPKMGGPGAGVGAGAAGVFSVPPPPAPASASASAVPFPSASSTAPGLGAALGTTSMAGALPKGSTVGPPLGPPGFAKAGMVVAPGVPQATLSKGGKPMIPALSKSGAPGSPEAIPPKSAGLISLVTPEQLQQQQEAEEARRKKAAEFEEARRIHLEAKKKEEEAKKEAAEADAKQMQLQLAEKLDAAEKEFETLSEATASFLDDEKMKAFSDPEFLTALTKDYEPLKAPMASTIKSISTFLAGKHKNLAGIEEETRKNATLLLQRLAKVERGNSTLAGRLTVLQTGAQGRVEAQAKKEAAAKEALRLEELFDSLAGSRDALLDEEKIKALCQKEYGFEIQEHRMAAIKRNDCFKANDGVPFAKFSILRALCNVAKQELVTKQKKEEEERRKVLMKEQMPGVEKKFKAVSEFLANIDAEVAKAEKRNLPLSALMARKPIALPQLESAVADVDTAVGSARDLIDVAEEQLQRVNSSLKMDVLVDEVKQWIQRQQKTLGFKLTSWGNRLSKVEATVKTAKGKIELQQRKEALLRSAEFM
mmetsp:Transcript_44341/g.95159  ORF Transcript_44341/g.95159 Transcript_44341/m.95159 type:complete len:603 (-) Transcript_44341:185-1993(-)